MLEALWTVEFITTQGQFGFGVAVFETGRIFGGDDSYYYLGRCDVKQGVLTGEVTVTHYAGAPHSVFGLATQFQIHVTGRVQEPVMDLQGYLVADPNQKMVMRCTKQADLP